MESVQQMMADYQEINNLFQLKQIHYMQQNQNQLYMEIIPHMNQKNQIILIIILKKKFVNQ